MTTSPDIDLRILSIREARDWVHGWPTDIVSIVDERADAVPRPDRIPEDRHLIVVFEDVTNPIHGVPATADDVRSLVEFGRSLDPGARCLVHCRGGIGRSTAGALCMLVARGHTMADSLAHVSRLRPQLQPNGLVIHLLDEVLSAGGGLFHEFHRWAYQQPWWTSRDFAPDPTLTTEQVVRGLATQTHRRRPR